jgi:hypothetical protein
VLRKGRGETGFAARAGETMKRKEVKEEKLAIKKKKKRKKEKPAILDLRSGVPWKIHYVSFLILLNPDTLSSKS